MLRSLLGQRLPQLAGRVTTEIKRAHPALATHAAVTLDQAFSWLKEKMPMPDERKQALEKAIEILSAEQLLKYDEYLANRPAGGRGGFGPPPGQ